VHADLFRDNVMFEGEKLTGFFDFYFAGNDAWLFDLSVSMHGAFGESLIGGTFCNVILESQFAL